MPDTIKYSLIIISCSFLGTLSETIVTKQSFQQDTTNSSKLLEQTKKNLINHTSFDLLTTFDHYFFSYDVIDHRTLLVKFDLTRTILFQQTHILYDAYLYVSKIPSINYEINIGLFSGLYEKELDGTTTDHFTFCLVLVPNRYKKRLNTTSNTNRTETIYQEFLMSSYQKQQRHIIHYCTKIGPDEDRHRHHIKQGSEGDHVLLLLQLMMIGIFLAVLQIVHCIRNGQYKEWRVRQLDSIRHEFLSRKEYVNLPNDTLAMLQFIAIDNEELQEEINEQGEENEDSLFLSYRRFPSRNITCPRSRPLSCNLELADINTDPCSLEHILQSKPWL